MSQTNHLQRLPGELILHISELLHPADFEAFVLTCTTTWDASKPAVRRHNELYQRHCVIRLGDDRDSEPGEPPGKRHPLIFLLELLANPWLAHYTKRLQMDKLRYYLGLPDDEDDIEDQDWGGSECVQTKLANGIPVWESELQALGENPWTANHPSGESWRRAFLRPLRPKEQGYFLAVLLLMLPNLRSLTMRSVTCDTSFNPTREMEQIVWAIAEANFDPASPINGKALSKLEEFSVHGINHGHNEHPHMYACFAALPSMRFLGGLKVHGHYELSEMRPHSSVEELKLVESAMSTDCLASVVRNCRALSRFTHHYVRYFVGLAPYNVPCIVDILRDAAGGCLEKLDLTAKQHFYTDQEKYQWIGDLKGFTKLSNLRVDDIVFQNPSKKDDTERPMEENIEALSVTNDRESGQTPGKIAALVDMLPSSIQEVHLVRVITVGDPADLFIDLVEEKEIKLPNLKKIILEGEYSLPQNLFDGCQRVGVEIKEATVEWL